MEWGIDFLHESGARTTEDVGEVLQAIEEDGDSSPDEIEHLRDLFHTEHTEPMFQAVEVSGKPALAIDLLHDQQVRYVVLSQLMGQYPRGINPETGEWR